MNLSTNDLIIAFVNCLYRSIRNSTLICKPYKDQSIENNDLSRTIGILFVKDYKDNKNFF